MTTPNFFPPTLTRSRINALWDDASKSQCDMVLARERFALAIVAEVQSTTTPAGVSQYMAPLERLAFTPPLSVAQDRGEVLIVDAEGYVIRTPNDASPGDSDAPGTKHDAIPALDLARFIVDAVNDRVALLNGTPPTDALEVVVGALSAMVMEDASDSGTISLATFKRATEALARAKYCVPVASSGTGMSLKQEPKYGIENGALFNRATNKPIPADEPVFIFRARDSLAVGTLQAYERMLDPASPHRGAVAARIEQFTAFAVSNPERMKTPDSSPGTSPTQHPKYGFENGALLNRATNTPIPADEPVFIFRARDNLAVGALQAYEELLDQQSPHRAAVATCIEQFKAFAVTNPDRMKTPDTAVQIRS